jgi:hypothetical protein
MKPWSAGIAFLLALAVTACGGQVQTRGNDSSPVLPLGPDVGASTAESAAQLRVVVTSGLVVEVPDLRAAYTAAGQLTRASGGYLADASIFDQANRKTAHLKIRVPASQHDTLLGRLRGLGERTVSETTTSADVSEEYTDLQSRLRNLQRGEAQYLELLGQARTIDEILTVSARIDGVRAETERLQGRLMLLDNLTELATINLTLVVPAPVATLDLRGPARVFAEAWRVSLTIALLLVDLAAILLVAAIWIGLPALLGAWLWTRMRRRSESRPAGSR